MLFQRTDGFHQGSLEVVTDTHDLSGGLHLSGKISLGCQKLIKGQARNLYHAVV